MMPLARRFVFLLTSQRRSGLALLLLVLGILANNHHVAFSLDDFALFANLLYGRFNFHYIIPFLSLALVLLCTPGYTALAGIIDRHLNSYLIAGQYFDIVHSKLSRDMCCYHIVVGKLYLEGRVGHCFNNHAFKFDYVILRQNSVPPSIIVRAPPRSARVFPLRLWRSCFRSGLRDFRRRS